MKDTIRELQVDMLLIVSFTLESIKLLLRSESQALKGTPNGARWSQPYEVRTDLAKESEEFTPVMGLLEIPT